MEYLSDEWITAFDRALASHEALSEASRGRRLVIACTLTAPEPDASDPDLADRSGELAYALVLDDGHNRCVAGPVADPDITIRTDRRTAIAIASNAESAQSAFMAGRIRLGGDVRVLMASQSMLTEIDDVTGNLRTLTHFDEPPTEP